MHEASLIQNLLEIVLESAAANGITRVERIHLVVGEGHGALPDALDFAFRALSQDTICAGGDFLVRHGCPRIAPAAVRDACS